MNRMSRMSIKKEKKGNEKNKYKRRRRGMSRMRIKGEEGE